MNPFPKNLQSVLKSYSQIIVPELNMGQLRFLLSGTFGIAIEGINQVRGKPFKISHLVSEFYRMTETQK
jgi:2-oxoglutarate/2-oxoacid ferredoxin oxidoreductase subunit alpha